MPSAVFRTIRMIEDARLHYRIERSRPDSIRLLVTMVGQRLEIDIFEDDHIEVCRFQGDESVEGDWDLLKMLLKTE